MSLSALLVVVVMVVAGQAVSQYFIHQPDGLLTVMAGDKVILPCKVENKAGPLQWTRDGFGLGTNRNLPGFPRLSMGGEDLRKDWDLVIDQVQVEDEAEYECQVGDIRSRSARLEVNVPSGPPVIRSDRQTVRVTEGVEAELECTSEGGKPAAKLVWGGDLVLTQHSFTADRVKGHKTFVSVSTVHLVPVRENDGAAVSCTASNVSPPVSATVSLDVSYKPRVNIESSVRTEDVEEGDDLQFTCRVSAKPSDVKLAWTLEGVDVTPAEDEQFFKIKKVSKQEHQKLLSCTATNTVGAGDDSLVLSVNYGPHIVIQPQTVHARTGETVRMTCQADSHPPASYTWYRVGDNKVYSFTSSLTTTATNTSEGSYYCQGRTGQSSSERSNLAKLVILRRPVIASQQTQYGDLLSNVSVFCRSNPTSENTSISWHYKAELLARGYPTGLVVGRVHDVGDDKYAVVNTAKEYIIESTITINNTTVEDFGVYTCTLENDLGTDTMNILLVNGDLPGDLVILRLVLAVLGFLSCILVGFVAVKCYQNFKNSLSEEQEQYLETERLETSDKTPAGAANARKRQKTESSENLSDECSGNAQNVQGSVLNTISKDFAAFYGNPHLSSHMESDEEDDDDDTGSVRIRLIDDQSHQPREFTAFYGNTRLSSQHKDDGGNLQNRFPDPNVRETATATRPKSVNFHPETTVFNLGDDVSEDPYAYDDIVMRIARDVDDDDEGIATLPETTV